MTRGILYLVATPVVLALGFAYLAVTFPIVMLAMFASGVAAVANDKRAADALVRIVYFLWPFVRGDEGTP